MPTSQDDQLRLKRLTTQYSNDRIMLQTTFQNLEIEQTSGLNAGDDPEISSVGAT